MSRGYRPPVSCARYGCRSRLWNVPLADREITVREYPSRPTRDQVKHREPNVMGTLWCHVCGHSWKPRGNKEPVSCPKCRRRHYQRYLTDDEAQQLIKYEKNKQQPKADFISNRLMPKPRQHRTPSAVVHISGTGSRWG